MKKIKTFREDYWKSRRDFLARTAFLFAAMGIGPSIRFDLTEKIARKMGIPSSTLMANGLVPSSGDQKFLLHWKFRSGAAFDQILFPMSVGKDMGRLNDGDACSTSLPISRLAYNHRPEEQITLPGSLPGTEIHFSKWAENLVPLVQSGKFNVAHTMAVRPANGHTGDYAMAKGGGSMNAPDPAVFLAGLYGEKVAYPGIEWKQNDGTTTNRTGPYSALQRVNGNTNLSQYSADLPVMLSNQARNFLNLFTPAVLPFTTEEVSLIASVSKKINENYAARSSHTDPEKLILTAHRGAEALTADLREAILNPLMENPGLRTDFEMDVNGNSFDNYQIRLGEASYFLLKAFEYAAVRSATMSITTGDWHSYLNDSSGNVNSNLNTRMQSRHAQMGMHIAKVIQAIFEYAETLPNPFTTDGSSLASAVNILMTSEFVRGPQKSNCNNIADMGRDGFVMIGQSVKNITGGDWSPVTGQTLSFNKQTGQISAEEPMYTHEECYATFCRAAGIPAEKIDQVAGINAAPIFAMLND